MQLHFLKGYIQNIYLVEYPEGFLLLDGCCRADVQTIKNFIEHERNRSFHDLKLVVVTHMHPDHAGGAHRLRKLTGCKIATGYALKPQWYAGVSGWLMHLTDVALGLYMAKRLGRPFKNIWYQRRLKADYILYENEPLPGFKDWIVVETHGHTDRDISLWHTPTHRIYVADLVVKVRQNFITPFPLFHPNRYKRSVNKVRNLNPDFVLLAHGGELETTQDHPCFSVHTPALPRTHWRATKYRFRRILQRAAKV